MVVPHGGPWGRDTWGYDTYAQFLANRGYAVLQPNFRASTGYGKKFLNLGNGKWGETMQDDITWGVKHLVAQGTVDPKRVGIMGGSYGGYATLAGVAFTPDLYAAGVAIVAPSNLLTLLDSIPPYWESVRTVFNVRMGDPGKAEDKARLMKQSPLNSADKIRTPLMVVQGQNDPRVKRAESDQIVIALRDRGFPVEYLVAPDEGHGFARPVNNMAMIASTEKFLAKHLGGRFQEEMPADVATRLKEITVDPKTVTLTAAPTAAAGAPKPVADLAPMKANYAASIAMGGQSMAMKIAQEAREENGAWVFTETADTPMGAATDSAVIEKGTLLIRKRTVKQGPADIALDFSDKAITGTLSMNGQSQPVNVALDGPVFADGPGSQRGDRAPAARPGLHDVVPQPRHPLAEGRSQAARGGGTRVGDGAGRHLRRVEGRGEGRRRRRQDAVGGRRFAPGREGLRDAAGDEWRGASPRSWRSRRDA